MDSLQFAHLVAHLTAEKLNDSSLTFFPLYLLFYKKTKGHHQLSRELERKAQFPSAFCKPIPISPPCIHSRSEGLMEDCLIQYLISER